MKRGLFITFEGADGCGKSTQLNMLAEYLTKKGFEVVVTREPGAKGLGEKIREILLNYNGPVSDRCESFLFLADRAQHIDMIVNPAIEAGKIVLCDRPVERIKRLNEIAVNGRHPDLTFVFDIDVETSMSRVGKVKDRMESAGMEFFNRVREGYLEIAKQEPQRVKVLDASKSIDGIHTEVVKLFEELL